MAKRMLGEFIEKWHVKKMDWVGDHKLEVLGVSNVEGITTTSHIKSEDLSNYLIIEPLTFAYNPYRINVGSVGLTPSNVYGLVSPAYVVFKVKKDKLIPELLLDFLKSFDGLQQINKYARGTVRKALRYDDLCKIEVDFPSYETQQDILIINKKVARKNDELVEEIKFQKQLISQLKQSILQDAIQGKLTKDWRKENPNVEPASELLKRIKAEKAQLVKEKKIKKEKALSAIGKEEIPFELPEGWAWCRLGDVLLYSDAGSSPQCDKRPASIEEFGVLTTTSIQENYFDELANKVLPSAFNINSSQIVEENDVLITRAGPLNRTGVACKVSLLSRKLILSDKTIRLKHPVNLINPDYLSTTLNSLSIRSLLIPKMTGMAQSQVNISQKNIKLTEFPLPPLEEQHAIAQKVESLMQKCSALEKEVAKSEAYAEMLMQAVLKEAFEGKEE